MTDCPGHLAVEIVAAGAGAHDSGFDAGLAQRGSGPAEDALAALGGAEQKNALASGRGIPARELRSELAVGAFDEEHARVLLPARVEEHGSVDRAQREPRVDDRPLCHMAAKPRAQGHESPLCVRSELHRRSRRELALATRVSGGADYERIGVEGAAVSPASPLGTISSSLDTQHHRARLGGAERN